jgi:thiamine biosynthesis lipoprotein
VFDDLRQVDAQFSTYKKDSELSQYRAGMIPASKLSQDMKTVMQDCARYSELTDGYFSAYFEGSPTAVTAPNRRSTTAARYNPTGYVKGWAIARAGKLLESHSVHTYMINAGGDILARSQPHGQHSEGQSQPAHMWTIGLQHPTETHTVIGSVRAANIAVATSGTYVRGQHILDPHTHQPARGLLSVTVIGPDIIAADVYATTIFAMGAPRGLAFIAQQPGYQALCIDTELNALSSPNFTANV